MDQEAINRAIEIIQSNPSAYGITQPKQNPHDSFNITWPPGSLRVNGKNYESYEHYQAGTPVNEQEQLRLDGLLGTP